MFDMAIQYRENKKHGNAEEVDIEEEPWRRIPINSVCVEEEFVESDKKMCDSVEQIFLEQTEHKESETIKVIH
jgi:hypothetical protein